MPPLYVLAADIGGTHMRARITAVSESGSTTIVFQDRRATEDVLSIKAWLLDIVAKQTRQTNSTLTSAVIGVPGRISKDGLSCAITHTDPAAFVSFGDLFAAMGVRRYRLLNDLACGVIGVANPREDRFEAIGAHDHHDPPPKGDFILGMPGTGLGIGIHARHLGAMASEGGHMAAALNPDDSLELAVASTLLSHLRRQPNHAIPTLLSYNLLLKGPSLELIYRAIASATLAAETVDDVIRRIDAVPAHERGEALARWAGVDNGFDDHLDQADVLSCARNTFDLFGRLLGRAMQAIALVLLPEGIYLGGNLVCATRNLFATSFVESFRSHGRQAALLSRCPLYVVDNPEINLDGATYHATALAQSWAGA